MFIPVESKSSSKSLLLPSPVRPDRQGGSGGQSLVLDGDRRRCNRYEGSDCNVILQETFNQQIQKTERIQGGVTMTIVLMFLPLAGRQGDPIENDNKAWQSYKEILIEIFNKIYNPLPHTVTELQI